MHAHGLCRCSYNEVNGVPACFSPFLRDVLRGNFRFDGYVTSDTDAISSANNHHNYHNDTNSTAPTTPLEAVTYALRDGQCDIESSVHNDNWFAHYIPSFVASGQLDEALVDRAVRDVFRVRFQAGLFDPWEGQPYARMQHTTHAADDAEEAQRDAIVLLKNDDHTLPFHLPDHEGYVLALIGPYAHLLQPRASAVVQPSGGSVAVERGCDVSSSDKSGFERALSAARNATHVLLCLGSDSSLEHEYHDRTNTTLAGVQAELARAVLANNPNKTAVILRTRGALAIDQLTRDAKAIVLAWEYGGDGHLGPIPSAVEAVFGAFSPSGRLPYTMYDADYITRNNFFTMSMTSPPGRSCA